MPSDTRRRGARAVVTGAVAGALATVPMTAFVLAAQRLGTIGRRVPWTRIAGAGLEAVGAERPPGSAQRIVGGLLHVGFGASLGALYAWGTARLGRRGPLAGAAFATGVWVASYAGWIPALGILPPPQRDPHRGRPATTLLAHWVFGTALDAAIARAPA